MTKDEAVADAKRRAKGCAFNWWVIKLGDNYDTVSIHWFSTTGKVVEHEKIWEAVTPNIGTMPNLAAGIDLAALGLNRRARRKMTKKLAKKK